MSDVSLSDTELSEDTTVPDHSERNVLLTLTLLAVAEVSALVWFLF
jgi:hypothetical protein